MLRSRSCNGFEPSRPVRIVSHGVEDMVHDDLCRNKFSANGKILCVANGGTCPFAEEQKNILKKRAELIENK